MRIIRTAVAIVLVAFASSGSYASQVLYGIEIDDRGLNIVDPLSGIEANQCFVSGSGVTGIAAMAASPTTGLFYVAVETNTSPFPELWRLDVRSCLSVNLGNLGDLVTGMAFDANNTLYAVTSDDNGGTTDTMFTVDLVTAALTFFMALPAPDGFGDTIAFNFDDGFMYHLTGEAGDVNVAFNRINLASKTATLVPLSGNRPLGSRVYSFTWDSASNYFVGFRTGIGAGPEYFSLTTAGVQTKLSDQDDNAGGRTIVGMAMHDTSAYMSPAPLASGQNLYIVDAFGPYITHVLPGTGQELGLRAVTIPGSTVFGFNGLAFDHTTGELYAIARLIPCCGSRTIIKIDPSTGIGQVVGETGERVAALAVDANGTLYASTTWNPVTPGNERTLWTVSKTDGSLTLHTVMGGVENGEALAFNSDDGLMYRASGSTSFEKWNLTTQMSTSVAYSGDMQTNHTINALTYDAAQGALLGYKSIPGGRRFFRLMPDGAMSDLNTNNIHKKGMAFSAPLADPIIDGDQDGDGKSDILFRNIASGANQLYLMDGVLIDQNLPMTPVAPSWTAVGRGDYNGDGKSDVLWRFGPTGALWIYFMNANFATSSKFVATVADSNWKVVGNGDYNGDGKSDILWRHQVLGTVWVYLMDANVISTSMGVGVVPNIDWQIVGSGDYNGDGKSDVLWRNVTSGTNWMYLMNGATITTSIGISTTPDLNWQIVGNGDYDGDGRSDILWRNSVSGTNWLYLMNGTSISTSASISVLPDSNWKIVGDGDYNGDGKADVLWRNLATGSNFMYLMNGLSIATNQQVSVVIDPDWRIVNTN